MFRSWLRHQRLQVDCPEAVTDGQMLDIVARQTLQSLRADWMWGGGRGAVREREGSRVSLGGLAEQMEGHFIKKGKPVRGAGCRERRIPRVSLQTNRGFPQAAVHFTSAAGISGASPAPGWWV